MPTLAAEAGTFLSFNGLEMASPLNIRLDVKPGIHATQNGITAAALETRLTTQLQNAKFTLDQDKPEGTLQLSVDTDASGEFLTMRLEFIRRLQFKVGERTYEHLSSVWSKTFTGKFQQHLEAIPLLAEQLTGEFLEAHNAANPTARVSGTITATDPKFQFVVVDLGKPKGIEPGQILKVLRDEAEVGRIKIMRTEDSYSVANVVDGTRAESLLEGDIVRP